MKNFFKKYKNYLIGLLFFSLIFSSLSFPFRKAEAIGVEVPVADWIQRSLQTKMEIKENATDAIFWVLAKTAIRRMTGSMINWINSGFQGSPLFLTDPQGFFLDVADQASGSLLRDLELTQMCDSWAPRIALGLRVNTFGQKTQCTLSKVVDRAQEFIRGDFASGGWKGWLTMIANDDTFYGNYLTSLDELDTRQSSAYQEYQNELNQGQGFLSMKKCEGGGTQQSYCDTHCSGLISQNNPTQQEHEDYNNCYATCLEKSADTSSLCTSTGGKMVNTTPGSVIADQLNLQLGSGVRQLEIADEVNESLAAIIDSLLNQLISKGLTSLSKAGGGSGNNWEDTAPSQDEKNDAIKVIDNTITTEKNYRTLKQDSYNVITELTKGILLKAKNCYSSKISNRRALIQYNSIEPDYYSTASTTQWQAEIDELEPKLAQINYDFNQVSAKYPVIQKDLDSFLGSNEIIIWESQADLYKTRVNEALEYGEVDLVLQDFNTYVASKLHNQAQYDAAKTENDYVNQLLPQAQIDYNECVILPY
jgi:hypothetical protein